MTIVIKYMILISVGASVAYLTSIYMGRCHSKVISFIKERMPGIVKSYLNKRRLKKIEKQIASGVDMLANCLKAGLSLQQSIEMVSKDGPAPFRDELAFVINQVRMGKSLEDALAEFKKGTPLEDIGILVESVLVLRQTGGNLVRTFSTIADTIRERQKICGKIRVLTSQGLTQAVIILIMPFALCIGLYFVASWYVEPLFTTTLGLVLVFFALCLQTLGALWLRKIITIKV